MKVIAYYLPQFYEFPENNKWWGDGFTEWTNVKKSKPLYKNHYQPTVPLNNNYYSLEHKETMVWQVELAKRYGISGFCFYHYWFGEDRQLMEKPVEMYLSEEDLDLPFCLCWANHNWTRTWVGGDKEILMDMRYGDEEEWKKHFYYLLKYFKDSRYIYIDEKPVLVIYMPQDIPCFDRMRAYYLSLAYENGLKGITFIAQSCFRPDEAMQKSIDYFIQYEPNCSLSAIRWQKNDIMSIFRTLRISPRYVLDLVKYNFRHIIKKVSGSRLCRVNTYSYDAIWDYVLKRPVKDQKVIAGALVHCDVSPRRQDRAVIFKGDTPAKFQKYLLKLIKKVNAEYSQQHIFVSAWNEWGEGMYLEPDEKHQYGYLEAVKSALESFKGNMQKQS